MSNINNEFTELIEKRKEILEIVDYSSNKTIIDMVNLLVNDVNKTIDFLMHECSGEQFVFMSEVFDEIVQKTKSKDLVDALYLVAERYPQETQKYNIIYFIDSAAEQLEQ